MIMELWVKVFLAMFALQLAPPVLCGDNLKFGDLIAINSPSKGNPPVPVYIHWSIYVGKGNVEGLTGKSSDEDIFYVYGGELSQTPVCVFDTLSKLSDQYVVNNYLDKDESGNVHTPLAAKDMVKEIMALHSNCLWWDPIMTDCEHVLAYVRYGKTQLTECKHKED